MSLSNHHRTAAFFHATSGDMTYKERANRFWESLMGNNIKVDFYLVIADDDAKLKVYRQAWFEPPNEKKKVGEGIAQLNQLFTASAYDQIIHSHSRHAAVDVDPTKLSATFLDLEEYPQYGDALKAQDQYEAEAEAIVTTAAAHEEAVLSEVSEGFDPDEEDWDDDDEEDED